MVGRAFGIIADFLYSVVKGFMDLVIFLLNVPMMMFSCIRENTMPLLRRAFTWTDDDVQRSTHAMTTRAMSRGGSAVRGGSVGPQLPSASERGYKRCLIWLIPLIGFLLLSGLVAKRCYDDEEMMANSEMLQYPTVIIGRTYEAASSVGQSVWWKICSLAIAGRTAAHATKERVITTLASQPWTSQWKIANTYESTKKTVSKTFSDGKGTIKIFTV
ncbi:unnamed protein product [Anisakis simplex]|uniref:SSD domain-containing protein n=1 Tax=Anisakis simplex TaxID=6269 RepID=A0A0M3J5C0_ANISI|nr:unnamed protein product [Anisakis simplex]